MSILERMRGSTDSTPMQIVLIAIVIAFVGWYALPQGEKVQVAVEVDGERVLVQEFGLRFGQAQRMVGRKLSEEDERELEATVKAQIARELVLTQEAVRRGYYVSPEEIGRSIKDTPAFHDRKGKFNKEQYDDAVKGSGRTRADFETDFRDQLLRDKLHSAVALGVIIDNAAVEREFDIEFASIDLEMINITPAQLAESMPITPEVRAVWIAANGPALQAAYDKDKAARFDLPERISLKTIRLPFTETDKDAIAARMEALRTSIAGGESMTDLALRWSEDPSAVRGGDLGERRLPTLTTKVRDAVADVPVGQVSAVIDETDRLALYQVVERKAAEVIPLTAVQNELADTLMVSERVTGYAGRLAAAWQESSRPEEVLAEGAAVVLPIPGVRPFNYKSGPGIPPKAAIDAAKDAEVGSVFGPFPGEGPTASDAFLIRVTGRPEVDRAQLDAYRQQYLDTARQAVWNAFGDDLQSRARINTGGGEATQGGWWEYFSWLLPES